MTIRLNQSAIRNDVDAWNSSLRLQLRAGLNPNGSLDRRIGPDDGVWNSDVIHAVGGRMASSRAEAGAQVSDFLEGMKDLIEEGPRFAIYNLWAGKMFELKPGESVLLTAWDYDKFKGPGEFEHVDIRRQDEEWHLNQGPEESYHIVVERPAAEDTLCRIPAPQFDLETGGEAGDE